jgi:hypothetical protein
VTGPPVLSEEELRWAELVCAVVRGQVPGQVAVAVRAEWQGRSVVVLAAVAEAAPGVDVRPLAILTDRDSAGELAPVLVGVAGV